MARDKAESHRIILQAAKQEFLEKGFEAASIRSIGKRAGVTSAALYRHAADKESLFAQVVEPCHNALMRWMDNHRKDKYALIERISQETLTAEHVDELFSNSEIDMILKVGLPYREEMKLMLTKAEGTRYEHLIHDFVEATQHEMMEVLRLMQQKGFPVADVSEKEMHTMLSAYNIALVEPIIHDYTFEETAHCLKVIEQFFIPGWKKIMGV